MNGPATEHPGTTSPTPVLIDCDPALGLRGGDIDDGFAIALAARMPSVHLVAITTVDGNSPAHVGVLVAREIVQLAGLEDLPIAAGKDLRLGGESILTKVLADREVSDLAKRHWPADSRVAQISDVPIPEDDAVELLLEMARLHADQLIVVAIGPLTNLARAILRDPQFALRLRSLIVMGGAFAGPGGVRELNFASDPEAADIVMRSGAAITMVPLDVTRTTKFTEADLTPLQQSTDDLNRFLAAGALPWIRFLGELRGSDGCHLHDPLAVSMIDRPGFVETTSRAIRIELRGEYTRGRPVEYDLAGDPFTHPAVTIVEKVDNQEFVRWITETLL